MAKKNGNGKAVNAGKVGVFTVIAEIDGKDVKLLVNVTADVIAQARAAVVACTTAGKDGKAYPCAYSRTAVDVGGESVTVTDLLVAIAQANPVFDGKPANGKAERKTVLRFLTGGLVLAGALVTRGARGGMLYYLPENAPAGANGTPRGDAGKALAALTS